MGDGVSAAWRRMSGADGLVLASPVYVGDVSGTMKTLIDRLAYVCHRPALFRTSVYVITTTGGSPARHTIRTMQGAVLSWGGLLVGTAGFTMGALMRRADVPARFGASAAKAARTLFTAANPQRLPRPGFINFMMFRIQQGAWARARPGSVDARYWADQGWLSPGATWYRPHRSGPIAVGLGRAVGAVVKKIFAG